jgi:hypothetical protein
MKLTSFAFTLLLIGSVGCKDDPEEAYATYQECFDDHTMVETLPAQEAIVVCCLEHPINGISPACGDIKADCINYLTINLNQTSASTTTVMDACADYVTQKNMP